jgi:hypothetical protein
MRNISELPDLQSRIRTSFERGPGCSRFLLSCTNKRDWGDRERPHPCTRLLNYHGLNEVKKRGQIFLGSTPEGKVAIRLMGRRDPCLA